jgi:hypothetical protein
MNILEKNPHMKSLLITNHGLLPLITMLTVENIAVINVILRLITQIIEDKEILMNLCIMGIIPVIMEKATTENPFLTRLYCAYFVQRVLSTNAETLQMFFASRGVSLLVGFLEPDYEKNMQLIHISIDCISSIFKLQGQVYITRLKFHRNLKIKLIFNYSQHRKMNIFIFF